MTWTPCQRIVRADVPPAFRIRGIDPCRVLCWPNATLGSGADYSVDFSHLLGCGGRIVRSGFSTSGGTIAADTISGNIVTAWIAWQSSGSQTVTVSVLTAAGDSLTVQVSVLVAPFMALLPAVLPEAPPNALAYGDVFFPDASGQSFLICG